MNLWIVPLILMIGTSLSLLPTLNLADAEALTIGNNSAMATKLMNATNSINVTDSEDQEDIHGSEEKEEEDNDIEEKEED
jgi:hypothetical protein